MNTMVAILVGTYFTMRLVPPGFVAPGMIWLATVGMTALCLALIYGKYLASDQHRVTAATLATLFGGFLAELTVGPAATELLLTLLFSGVGAKTTIELWRPSNPLRTRTGDGLSLSALVVAAALTATRLTLLCLDLPLVTPAPHPLLLGGSLAWITVRLVLFVQSDLKPPSGGFR